MKILENVQIVTHGKRRLGQGHGSGRGKTGGRGTKGQKARGNIPLKFEGGALPLIKRLPFLRGKDKNKSFKPSPFVINLSALEGFKKNDSIDVKILIEKKIVPTEALLDGVKILGDGELFQALTVNIPVSKSAALKIEKAGGTISVQK